MGRIIYNGEDINRLKSYQILARGISLVPEGRRIFPRLTVLENLLIGAYLPQARKGRSRALEKVFALFPVLADRSNQPGTNLSGGEQQMLAIARSLMSEPKLILFDEISLGLAPTTIKTIYSQVQEINRSEVTMVLVEQDVQRSLRYADYAYVIQEGRVVLHGEPSALTEKEVRQAYFWC